MDDRSPEKKYAFPNDEMIQQEKKLSEQKSDETAAPAREQQPQPPLVDMAAPYETQGLNTQDVPPADQTISSENRI